jgi:hypothetical protein
MTTDHASAIELTMMRAIARLGALRLMLAIRGRS